MSGYTEDSGFLHCKLSSGFFFLFFLIRVQTYRSSDIDVEREVFGWRKQQAGGDRVLILLLLLFILRVQVIDVSAQVLYKYSIHAHYGMLVFNLKDYIFGQHLIL